MKLLITNTLPYNAKSTTNILVENGCVKAIAPDLHDNEAIQIDGHGLTLLPGLVDVHVHFREPGFEYKETIATGTLAAAAGGYTAVCTMPNLKPTPDNLEHLNVQREIIRRDAIIKVFPYGCITVGQVGKELADIEALNPYVCAFSDDGHGVQKDEMMQEAMMRVKQCGSRIAAHCEVNSLLHNGYIHQGEYAATHNHRGICSQSEWEQIARDVELVAKTGCQYHVCHISTKESVEIIRKAKQQGLPVTCETAPHYLLLTDKDLKEEGRYKMNPPVRSEADQEALIQGVLDGTIDIIATDHAPHSAEEKSRGLEKSAFGIVGIETAFPLLYTNFVRTGKMTMDKLVALMSHNPRKIFQLENPIDIVVGSKADFTLMDLNACSHIDSSNFKSKGKATPFENVLVYGRCCMTIVDGKIVFQANN
ncbi:MAG: dihydroorotase [Bacteroidales bacterium]|nr:dihydroorotase [Bacteroidales bacterium]